MSESLRDKTPANELFRFDLSKELTHVLHVELEGEGFLPDYIDISKEVELLAGKVIDDCSNDEVESSLITAKEAGVMFFNYRLERDGSYFETVAHKSFSHIEADHEFPIRAGLDLSTEHVRVAGRLDVIAEAKLQQEKREQWLEQNAVSAADHNRRYGSPWA